MYFKENVAFALEVGTCGLMLHFVISLLLALSSVENVITFSPSSNSFIRYTTLLNTMSTIFPVAPQMSISSARSSYNEGSAVSITCTASGTPDPDVKWFRNGKMKSEGTKTALLTFNNVSRTDDDRYKCQANNSAGDSENYVALVVHCK